MMGSDEPSGRARRPTSSIPRNILAERRIAARAQVDPVRVAETFALSPRRERVQVPLRGAPGEIHATAAAGRPEVYDSSIWNGDLQTSSLGRRRASSSLAAATRHRHASAGPAHVYHPTHQVMPVATPSMSTESRRRLTRETIAASASTRGRVALPRASRRADSFVLLEHAQFSRTHAESARGRGGSVMHSTPASPGRVLVRERSWSRRHDSLTERAGATSMGRWETTPGSEDGIRRDTSALGLVSARLDAAATAIDAVETGVRSASDSLDSLLHLLETRSAAMRARSAFPPNVETRFRREDTGLGRSTTMSDGARSDSLWGVSASEPTVLSVEEELELGEMCRDPVSDRKTGLVLQRQGTGIRGSSARNSLGARAGSASPDIWETRELDVQRRTARVSPRRGVSSTLDSITRSTEAMRLDSITRSTEAMRYFRASNRPVRAAEGRGSASVRDLVIGRRRASRESDHPAGTSDRRWARQAHAEPILDDDFAAREGTTLTSAESQQGETTEMQDSRLRTQARIFSRVTNSGTAVHTAGRTRPQGANDALSADAIRVSQGRSGRDGASSGSALELEVAIDDIDLERSQLMLELARLRGQQYQSLSNLLRLQQEQFLVRQWQVSNLSDIVSSFGRTVEAAGALPYGEDFSSGRVSDDVVSAFRRIVRILRVTHPAAGSPSTTSGLSATASSPEPSAASSLYPRHASEEITHRARGESVTNDYDRQEDISTRDVFNATREALTQLAGVASVLTSALHLHVSEREGPDAAVVGGAGESDATRRCSAQTIDALPDVPRSGEGNFDMGGCVICLSEQETAGQMLCYLPCNHAFHRVCVSRWLRVHASCPTCRAEVPDVDDSSTPGSLSSVS